MTLVAFLFRRAPRGVIWAAFAGVASGLTSTGVLALVPRLVEGAPSAWSILGFVLLALVSVVSKCASEILLVRLGQAGVSELRRNLSRDILEAPLERVESLGPARLLAALNEDVAALSQAFIYLPIVCVNAATVVGCLVYLGWIALEVLGIVLGALALGSVAFWMQSQNAERYFSKARGESDRLFEYFRGLVQGLKELKMQRERGELFLSERLGVSVRAYEREYVAGSRSFSVAMAWGNLLFFVALGVTVIGLPLVTELGRAEVMAAALTLLFLLGPFAQVVEVLPVLSRANVALAHLRAIGLDLPREAMCQAEPGGGNGAEAAPEGSLPWREIQLSGVTHHYYREYEAGSFTLGPIELSLRPGEIVFLIGGNGSGKTTLSKLLLGLYEPKSGELRLDGRLVDDGRRDRYRGLFSTVFADYHLFSDLSGLERPEQRERARRYLERLKLDRTVRIVDGHFEFAGLSQGQRKRLALVVAALDDRPFYVFDEWASDQDPSFRRFFYTELLPELKARGKAVLVISHDDQYFGVADRCLRMDLGSVAEVRPGVSDGLQSVVSA